MPRMEVPAVLPMWMKKNVPLILGRMMGLVTIVVLVMVLLLGTVALVTLLTVLAATVALSSGGANICVSRYHYCSSSQY